MLQRSLRLLALSVALLAPATSFAQSADTAESAPVEGPSLFAYGWQGFWTGAGIGLATGYVATGHTYESYEWKTLVLGAGIGALSGLTLGVSLAITDAAANDGRMGWIIMRDAEYGSLLGAFAGAAVGALVWIDDGRSKDVLSGAAIGTLIGAGVGVVFGVIEGSAAARHSRAQKRAGLDLHLSLGAVPSARGWPGVGPSLLGRF
jgi:hypothetical protein